MRLYTCLLLACVVPASSFSPAVAHTRRVARASTILSSTSSTDAQITTSTTSEKRQKYLGLLTFDLDDSLYPLEKVINEANEAFVRAMNNYGFTGTHGTT